MAIILVACNSQPEHYTLSGRVEGDLNALGEITLTSFDGYEKEIEVNPDGTFKEVLSDEGAIYFFDSGGGGKMIYAHDSGTLKVTLRLDEDGKWEPHFSGDGAHDIDFVFGVNKAMTDNNLIQNKDIVNILSLSQEEYIKLVEKFHNDIYQFIEKADKKVSEDAKTAMMTDLDAARIYLYDFYKSWQKYQKSGYDKNGKIETVLQENNDFNNIKSSAFKVSMSYRQMANGHWRDKASIISKLRKINKYVAFNQIVAEGVENEKIRNGMVFYNTKRRLIRTDDDDLQNDLKNSFLTASTDPIHRSFINDMYDQILKTGNGQPAPMFENYENHDGDLVSLSDLKGKNVYIDFWATWCAPCKKEFPHLKKIEKKYHDSNIVFVGISLDKESKKDAWRRMVDEEGLMGLQLFADNSFNSAFAKAFQISAIPRFVLIDKEGKIVSANAPRPSDEKGIDEIFKTLDL
jgi:thiol-disulfide isomerase/thioredoxin